MGRGGNGSWLMIELEFMMGPECELIKKCLQDASDSFNCHICHQWFNQTKWHCFI